MNSTKAKIVLAAGLFLLLAVFVWRVVFTAKNRDTASKPIPVTTTSLRPVDDSVWLNLNRRDSGKYKEELKQAPPALIVRKTHYPLNPTNGVGIHYGWIDEKLANLCVGLSELVMLAYSKQSPSDVNLQARTEFPEKWTHGHFTNQFDVIVTITNRPREALQAEIKKYLKEQFGWSWHRESQETAVLLLKVKNPQILESKTTEVFAESKSIREFIGELENYFGKPVEDQTGTVKRYDNKIGEVPARWVNGRTTDLDANNVFLNQYGLELVPNNKSIERLVLDH